MSFTKASAHLECMGGARRAEREDGLEGAGRATGRAGGDGQGGRDGQEGGTGRKAGRAGRTVRGCRPVSTEVLLEREQRGEHHDPDDQDKAVIHRTRLRAARRASASARAPRALFDFATWALRTSRATTRARAVSSGAGPPMVR